VVTENVYENTCETKEGEGYYKKCDIGFSIDTFSEFLDNVLCEGFVVGNAGEYEMSREAARKEVVGIAVKMKRIEGKNISLVQDLSEVHSTYSDVGTESDSAAWIAPVVATALKYGMVTSKRSVFEPERSVTRAEAFAMIMKSVCMLPVMENTSANWQENVYATAARNGVTIRDASTFAPNAPILRSELVTISSRTADWAERTGGCDPKPQYCFLPE
jgi:hypothetical protein